MPVVSEIAHMYNYKVTTYPVDLNKTKLDAAPQSVRSLVDICATKIVQDASSTRRAVRVVPKELCYSLMKAAILETKDRAIDVLIANWPWAALGLPSFASRLFDDLAVLYDESYHNERIRRGVKYTTCLAHTFVECLKKRSATHLKYLDISGYPAAEVIVNYLSSHVLLVYNETRQKEIISMYNKVTQDMPEDCRQEYSLHSTLPESSYVVCLDAFLQTAETHMELCRALQTSQLDQCHFKLRLNTLDAMCLGVPRIAILLDQVDPKYLTGLSLQFNDIGRAGLLLLGPAISKLINLRSLDLSCNSITVSSSPDVADLLGQALASLPLLTRLDLSNNRTKHKLYKILGPIPSPLEFLKLCGCGLSAHDLVYMKGSHHAQALRELDISCNCLEAQLQNVLNLLKVLGASLVVLEMEDVILQAPSFFNLVQVTCDSFAKLRLWNMARNEESMKAMNIFYAIPSLAKIGSLECVKLSYPTEVLDTLMEEAEVDMVKIAFAERMAFRINRVCEAFGRGHIEISFIGQSD